MTKTMTHVEELRHVAAMDSCSWDYAQKLMRSSADQIERLRAAIQWIADYPDPVGRKEPWHEAWHQCVWKAEEALNGGPDEPSARQREIKQLEQVVRLNPAEYDPSVATCPCGVCQHYRKLLREQGTPLDQLGKPNAVKSGGGP